MQSWISTLVLIGVMLPAVLHAQQDGESTARLPRPKVAADAQYDLGRGGYPVRVFFEEGKSFSHPTAHVFYEPLIYLVTTDEGKLRHHIRGNNELVLFFRVETDNTFLVDAIRDALNKTAQEESKSKIVPGTLKYRISPLTMSESWFASSLSNLRSSSFKNKSIVERGEIPFRFPTKTKAEAETFLQELELGVDQLVFKYTFSGVSDDVCEVEFKGENTQAIDLYKKVTGVGGEGFVTRDQAVDIADSMVATESLSGRCGSSEWMVYLTDKLLDTLGMRTVAMEDGWAKLHEFTAFDPKSFSADVRRKTKDIEKGVSRRIIDESVAAAESEGEAWAMEGGGSAFGFGASASYSEANSETRAEAKKDFKDVMEKMGVLGEWEGEVYIPKSVDVYSVADMRRTWGTNLRFEYRITTGATAEHSINLTKESYWSRVQKQFKRRIRKTDIGRTFRDCDGCPLMVVVPAGTFRMGSPSSLEDRGDYQGPVHRPVSEMFLYETEYPAHEVTIQEPFAVGVHEVTRSEFARFVEATDHFMGDSCSRMDISEDRQGLNWHNLSFPQTGDHPVVCVNWRDAQHYVSWLSEETGEDYRLLSESEWEYVARGGTVAPQYWGGFPGSDEGCRNANHLDASAHVEGITGCNDGYSRTAPVGSFTKNDFGLYDVLGNVAEWTQDCWNGNYNGAPTDGRAWEMGDCNKRVIRGSSWGSEPRHLRVALRLSDKASLRHTSLGLRIARTLTP